MNNLYIDYEKGLGLGKKICDESVKLNELLLKLENIQNKINENHTSDDIKKLNIDLRTIIKLSEIVGETGNFLINVSNAYMEVDKIHIQKEEEL